MNVVCNSFVPLNSDEFSTTAGVLGDAELVVRGLPVSTTRSAITVDPETNSVYGLWYDAGRPATEPQASAVKRGLDTAVSTVKAKKWCTAQGKSEPAPLPVTALADSSLQWDRLAAMAMFASKQTGENVVQLVWDNGGIDTAGAREALVDMLTEYINDHDNPPLRISGREPVPKVIKVVSKHASADNPILSSTDTKWFYWEEGKGKKWFGEEPAGYKATAPAAPAAATSTDADTGADPPRSPRQACIVTLPYGSPSVLNATLRLIDSPTSGALTGTVSTGNLVYKRQQRGDYSEVEDLCGNSGWIRDKHLKESDGTKTPVNYG